MNLKQILSTALFSSVALAAIAQQVTISPLPQSIAWGEKAFDRQTAFNVVGAETADADAVNALTAKYEATGGSIELIIGERGDAAVAEFEIYGSEGTLFVPDPNFFDGQILTPDTPRRFFGSNSFYTTAANRMSRHVFSMAITAEDVARLCLQNREAEP